MISDLREISLVLGRYSEDFILQFEASRYQKSKLATLYKLIQDKKYTEEDIAKELGYVNANSKSFYMLCARLKDRMLSALVVMDVKSNASKIRKKVAELNKTYIQCSTLLISLKRNIAIKMMEGLINETQKYDLVDITLWIADKLSEHYAYIINDDKKWKYYEAIRKETLQEMEDIHLVNKYYNIVSNLSSFKSKSHADELSKSAEEFSEVLVKIQKHNNNFRFNQRAYEIRLFHLNQIGQYNNALDLAQEAYEVLSKKPYFNRTTVIALASSKIDAYLNLKDYKNALAEIDVRLKHTMEGGYSWFRTYNQKWTILSVTEDFDSMWNVMQLVMDNKKLKKHDNFQEQWKIREAYVHFLIKAGKLKPSEGAEKDFRLTKFLNEVPLYSKDKRGVNTALIILQILFYILDGKLDRISDRLDSLNKYCHRYLRKDESYRYNCFIKMLLKLPEGEYHPTRTNRYVKRYLEKLANYPREITIENFSPEIIDFTTLWEIIIDQLPQKGYKSRRKVSALG